MYKGSVGQGDNGGLRVLLVSTDDREIKDHLKDNDYVGMVAVLLFDYAKVCLFLCF